MNEEIKKSLTDLIDETLMELEELKKSRFSPAEIEIKGPGEGIAGKPSDGKLDAAKAEDEKDEEKEEDEEDEKAEKSEKDEDPADSEETKRKLKGVLGEAKKAEDKKDEDKDEDKKDEDAKGGDKHESEERKAIGKLADLAGMKKSEEEMSSLMKSFVEERVKPLEDKLSTILEIVNKMADQPVAPKGATARTVPLLKSADEGAAEPLSKAQVASKLFELKKSGSSVDSLDVTKAEMGQDLEQIVKKYKLS